MTGDVVVSDAATKRYSGSFTRETHAIQSRTPPLTDKSDHHNQMLYDAIPPSERRPLAPSLSSDMMMSRGSNPEVDSVEAADLVGAVGGEEPQGEGPTEELIHETAVNIASMGDELNSEYKTRLEVLDISLMFYLVHGKMSYFIFGQRQFLGHPAHKCKALYKIAQKASWITVKGGTCKGIVSNIFA